MASFKKEKYIKNLASASCSYMVLSLRRQPDRGKQWGCKAGTMIAGCRLTLIAAHVTSRCHVPIRPNGLVHLSLLIEGSACIRLSELPIDV